MIMPGADRERRHENAVAARVIEDGHSPCAGATAERLTDSRIERMK